VTAQNTREVSAIHPIPPDMVLAQVRAVLADIRVDAVKVGMLGTVEVAHAVAQALDELAPGTPVVVDPVMVSESGSRLLTPDAQRALIEEILPRATVLTPNLPEARVLAGDGLAAGGLHASESAEQMEAEALARGVLRLGPRRASRSRRRPVSRRGRAGEHRDDRRSPSPGRHRPRLGLHALLDPGRAARSRSHAA
jgi:hydroxymethylpyrimidine/phosphomethylpyrimidine kinase